MNEEVVTGLTGVQAASDANLLLASARRDAAAFAELVSRYYKPVYRMVWRMMNGNIETEDVAQEAFVKLWQNPSQVREAKALKGWLMRVASNLAIDRLRRKPHTDLDAILYMRPDAPGIAQKHEPGRLRGRTEDRRNVPGMNAGDDASRVCQRVSKRAPLGQIDHPALARQSERAPLRRVAYNRHKAAFHFCQPPT